MRKSILAFLAIALLVSMGAGRLSAAPIILRRGSTGTMVRELQKSLATAGMAVGAVDGVFGPVTEKAVKSFQAKKKLAVDGIVGPRTRAALEAEIKAIEKAKAESRRLEEKRASLEALKKKTLEARKTAVASLATSVAPGRGSVYLTFDDGPDPSSTPEILDELKKAGVRATFFVIGSKVEQYPEIVQRMVREGHAVQNHGYSHSNDETDSRGGAAAAAVEDDISRAASVIYNACGVRTSYFRPPYGKAPDAVLAAARRQGHTVALWSNIWGKDGAALMGTVFDGAVLMLNEEAEVTARKLPGIISSISTLGYRFATLDRPPELTAPAARAGPSARDLPSRS